MMKVEVHEDHNFAPNKVFVAFTTYHGQEPYLMLLDLPEGDRVFAELMLESSGDEGDVMRNMILAAYKAGMDRCKTFHVDPVSADDFHPLPSGPDMGIADI